MKVVIMAGGKGTRISSVASDIPKPMIKVEGIPVLEREIECLKNQGFDDIILTVSHLGNIIMDYFGDGSGNSPVTVSYTHLRAHETDSYLVCRLLLEKKNKKKKTTNIKD